jgi:hypothetical protein
MTVMSEDVYKVTVDGYVVECNSTTGLLRLLHDAKKTKNTDDVDQQRRTHKQAGDESAQKQNAISNESATLTFLEGLRNANGLNSEHVAELLGVKNVTGVGRRLVSIRNVIIKLGFDPELIFPRNGKGKEGQWMRGQLLDEAIAALQSNGKAKAE